ncbi:MAG: S8 family serine peptidase [Clostridia bacterium]|nr:S8 family serine peptidase [Clostridia bacterium]
MNGIFKKFIAVLVVILQLFSLMQASLGIKLPDAMQDFIDSIVQSGDEVQNRETLEEIAKLLGADGDFTGMSYAELKAFVENLLKDSASSEDEADTPATEEQPESNEVATVGYDNKTVLVKVKDSFNADLLGALSYTSAEALYNGSKWYTVTLSDALTAEEAVAYLTNLNTFECVDYDYVMGTTANETENPNYNQQTNLGLSNIPYGWTQNGKAPGGSSDVVVAVIDTGVDYNHLDLRNNIWVNTAEIANNGRDDDGNGYIDDVYGWDFVGNDKDPMDDNGHGTHVAGIIAAENNKQGGIGVAYNCKVMALKAGNSSGYFNNSDIAEAVQYAYMNGASVINMSFGGSQISIAVEEALENAYNSCVLVAAAGNDSACNDLSCKVCDIKKVSYPAALPYVIGVMSTDANGNNVSSFSNYDHNPYNSVEYEVFAVGEGVGSTWPSDKYACLNGTSMAAPTVSGIAALLRSNYTDREVYSTKFIQSQIVNTGTVNPYNYFTEKTDDAHAVADVQEALTKLPKPEVNLYDYSIDDSTAINSANNGNGVVDAGETVRLYIALHNRGGVATDVNVSIDTDRGMGMTDPYFTFVNSTLQLSDIGTYSERESGDKYFEIVVDADCPNDYLADFNIRYTYKNGMDENDDTVYEDDGKQKAQFNVSSGYLLPSIIAEDTTFTNDRLYIVGDNVVISKGVTVTFEEGCQIQFYDDRDYYSSPVISVYGKLSFDGTQNNTIKLAPNNQHTSYVCGIKNYGQVLFDYVETVNLVMGNMNSSAGIEVSNSMLRQCLDQNYEHYFYKGGSYSHSDPFYGLMSLSSGYGTYSIYNTYIEDTASGSEDYQFVTAIDRCYFLALAGNRTQNKMLYDMHNSLVYTCSVGGLYNSSLRLKSANNNYFVSSDESPSSLIPIVFSNVDSVENNSFSLGYQKYANQVIKNYLDANGNPTVDVYGSLADPSLLWPYVVDVEMFDKAGNPITTVGKEEIKVRVTFNRPMDTTKDTYLTFGTIEPYADYKIEGEYISDTVWEGTYTLKAQIENGQNYLKVNNACAAEDQTKVVFGEYQLHEFTIDTTAALAMNLFAIPTNEGINLSWNQDDYDTLMGYNIYRADSKDGNYVKINPSVMLPTDESFLDDNAEPGKTYWYTFTVVLSDFSESAPAGKVSCTAMDTLNPTIYHTPVNQGYAENNLVISCTASDNMQIASVNLYYRTVGTDAWKTLSMSKVNDKYNATIFGSDLSLDGLEYYIVASDGVNTVSKGTADEPYTVVIKDASFISRIGDVDGSGSVTTKDALMLMQCLNGDLILTDDAFRRADLNSDGELSSAEALRILQYINGKVSTLEM